VLCDVGCASFWYAATLQSFFRPDRLVGVEVEGHRLFWRGGCRCRFWRPIAYFGRFDKICARRAVFYGQSRFERVGLGRKLVHRSMTATSRTLV
jgi:hypothetical protein